jgi:hypothetical protein
VRTAILVRQVVWSSFGSYHLEGIIWFLFERILGIIWPHGEGGSSRWLQFIVIKIPILSSFGIHGDCKVTVKRMA